MHKQPTYRERREAKAERLREWAEKREAKADAASERAHQLGDAIPFGQPILVGHHSEKRHRRDISRIGSAMDAAVENGRKADEMASRADEIDRQAANAIYNDDPDAVERLTEKIAKLEAERDQIKAYNKGRSREERAPAYMLTNLGGNIRRLKKRLEELSQPETGRWITARFESECRECGEIVERGDRILYYRRTKSVACESCAS